jgi:hypothetical protein
MVHGATDSHRVEPFHFALSLEVPPEKQTKVDAEVAKGIDDTAKGVDENVLPSQG